MNQSKYPSTSIDSLLAIWSIQDALLQQYRVIFVTMQSIFIAFGGLMVDPTKPMGAMAAITALAGVTLWLWWSLCGARGRSVFFVQHLILKVERGESLDRPLDRLKTYQENDAQVLDDPDYKRLLGAGADTMTRSKMDNWLPLAFVAAWGLLWAARY